MVEKTTNIRYPNAIQAWQVEDYILLLHYYEPEPQRRWQLMEDFKTYAQKLRGLPTRPAGPEEHHMQVHLLNRQGKLFALFIDGLPTLRSVRVKVPEKIARFIRTALANVEIPDNDHLSWAEYDIEVQAMRNFLRLLYRGDPGEAIAPERVQAETSSSS